jgi:hypothetical protein
MAGDDDTEVSLHSLRSLPIGPCEGRPASGSPNTLRRSDPTMQEAGADYGPRQEVLYVKCLDNSGQ